MKLHDVLLTPHVPKHSLLPSLREFTLDSFPRSYALSAWRDYYLDTATNPLHPALLFCGAISMIVWLLGEITGNVSQVDRLWTTLPLIYSAHFTFIPYLNGSVSHISDLDHRMLLVFALQCCWSARLTYQSARRGFLDPRSEDYRWPLVRNKIPTWAFKLLNFVFIAWIQNILLMIAELPQYLLLTHSLASSGHVSQLKRLTSKHAESVRVPLNVADAVLAAAFLTTLVFEMRADNQQQRFQNLKHAALKKDPSTRTDKEKKAIERGFVTGGLWSWMRHPNFACEQLTWYILYGFTVLPFLPLASSITSHPLSTFSSHLTRSNTTKFLVSVSDAFPSIDQLLTAIEHPIAYFKHLDLDWNSLRTRIPADLKLAGSLAVKEWKRDEGVYWNYTIVAPLLMSSLFFASTDLTEKISAGKYPLYKVYQKRVAMFVPAMTTFKGLWLFLTGRRGKVDRQLFGTGEKIMVGKIKEKKL
ncbi:uncharacterized protein JCM15063_004083 [Sporobolomyces koalae]|uniref:uncharacterized protein n=1 Tax=Sporobolomyces koalae TaxID=500713 RepID=UPI00317F2A4A